MGHLQNLYNLLLVIFQPNVEEAIAEVMSGWNVKKYGWVEPIRQIPGFNIAHTRLFYHTDPKEVMRKQVPPIVASRLTPEHHRESHLDRAIQLNDGRTFTLAEVAQALITHQFNLPEIEVKTVPILDVSVMLPRTSETLYFAGLHQNDNTMGAACIFDGDKYDDTIWVNDNKHGPLAIAPQVGDKLGVFSVTDVVRAPGPESVYKNCITVLLLASDPQISELFKYKFLNLLPSPNSWDLTGLAGNSGGYGYEATRSMSFGGGNPQFAQRGENERTDTTTILGKSDPSLKHLVMLNIFPMVIDPALTGEDRAMLEGLN